MLACLALLVVVPNASWGAPAKARAKVATVAVALSGVELEHLLLFQLPAGAAWPNLRLYPAQLGAEVDLPLPFLQVQRDLASLPKDYNVKLSALEGATRLVLYHDTRKLVFSAGPAVDANRGRNTFGIRFGYDSEETRLRRLADFVRHPLPLPEALGAQLELWQEAERETNARNVQVAMRLWEKLAEQPALRDLAEVRAAQLFIITGHIGEAIRRLRAVSRQYPRASGATLARIIALHLETIIEESKPNAEQILLAGRSGNRPRLRSFVDLCLANALLESGYSTAAIVTLPSPGQMSAEWREATRALEHEALAQAILGTSLRKAPYDTLIQYRAWIGRAQSHPDLPLFSRAAADAYMQLGLYAPAVPLLRQQIANFPHPGEEARLVIDLARAYLALDETDHLREVVNFLVRHHPDAPGAIDILQEIALDHVERENLPATLAQLAQLRKATPSRTLVRKLYAIELDLLAAWGTPAQTVQSLMAMREVGFDDPEVREPALAVALARDGQSAQAEPRLRRWVNKATNPEERDEMAYLLAQAEESLGRNESARKILDELSSHGTRWGLVARARLREQALTKVVDALEAARQSLLAKNPLAQPATP